MVIHVHCSPLEPRRGRERARSLALVSVSAVLTVIRDLVVVVDEAAVAQTDRLEVHTM